jgi:hypothetical protein
MRREGKGKRTGYVALGDVLDEVVDGAFPMAGHQFGHVAVAQIVDALAVLLA